MYSHRGDVKFTCITGIITYCNKTYHRLKNWICSIEWNFVFINVRLCKSLFGTFHFKISIYDFNLLKQELHGCDDNKRFMINIISKRCRATCCIKLNKWNELCKRYVLGTHTDASKTQFIFGNTPHSHTACHDAQ